jgi:hypothetical protein
VLDSRVHHVFAVFTAISRTLLHVLCSVRPRALAEGHESSDQRHDRTREWPLPAQRRRAFVEADQTQPPTDGGKPPARRRDGS